MKLTKKRKVQLPLNGTAFSKLPDEVIRIIFEFTYSSSSDFSYRQNYLFHRTIELNHTFFTALMIERSFDSRNSVDVNGFTPIMKLCMNDDNLVVLQQYLFALDSRQIERKNLLKWRSRRLQGVTALHVAAFYNCLNICRFILEFCGEDAAHLRTYKVKDVIYKGNVFRYSIPLDFAIANNANKVLKYLLPLSNVNAKGYTGLKSVRAMPAIFYATHYGDLDTFRSVLVKSNVNITCPTFDWHFKRRFYLNKSESILATVLETAIEDFNVSVCRLQMLISFMDESVLSKHKDSIFKCVCAALRHKRYETCKLLLRKFGAKAFPSSSSQVDLFQLLCCPCNCNDDPRELIQEFYNKQLRNLHRTTCCPVVFSGEQRRYINWIYRTVWKLKSFVCQWRSNSLGYRPIHYAAMFGLDDIIKQMLTSGEDVDARGYFGETPLHLATLFRQYKVVKVLLKFNASVHICDHGHVSGQKFTPLLFAVGSNDLRIVKALVRKGADTKVITRNFRVTLVSHTVYLDICELKATKILDILKPSKEYLNVKDANGKTALHWAVILDKPFLVHYLLKKGANVDVRSREGLTPLMIACRGHYCDKPIDCRYDIVKELVEFNANYKLKFNDVDTAVDFAKATDEYNDDNSSNVYLFMKRHFNLYD